MCVNTVPKFIQSLYHRACKNLKENEAWMIILMDDLDSKT